MCTGETGDLKIQQSDFLRAFWPNKYNCKRLNLKVKYIQYNAGVIKNYCIKISMQKISSIHKLIFKIQQI